MVPSASISGVVWIYTQWRADPRNYTQSSEDYILYHFAMTSLCCHPLSLCSSLTRFQLCFLMRYFRLEIGPLLLTSHPTESHALEGKNLHLQQHSSKALYWPGQKKSILCVSKHSTGGSVPILAFMEKEHGDIISKILFWFFGAGKAKKKPALSLTVNEDEAFWANWILIFFTFPFQALTAIFKLGENQHWKGCSHPDRLYGGASQAYSMSQHRDVKELGRFGKPQGS